MSISEDTAALVAAQLTVAWATRIGDTPDPKGVAVGYQIHEAYRLNLDHVLSKHNVTTTPGRF